MEMHANYPRRYCASEIEFEPRIQPEAKQTSWQWDIKTDITTWSEPLYRIAGRDPRAGVPSFKEHSSFYTSVSWDRLSGAIVRALQTGQPYELELQMRRPDGTQRRVIASGEAVRDSKGDILRLCGTVEDVTERYWQIIRREEPARLRNGDSRISTPLIQAHEEENARTAKALRDHICQKLCLLAVEIKELQVTFPELPRQAQIRLKELWRDAAETNKEILQVSDDLYPSHLDLLGLPLAIRGFCREFANRNGVSVECRCTDVLLLNEEVALSFFRVLQELLSNVAEHSHASNVIVELTGSSMEVLLRVSDDGVGMELEKTKSAAGLGFVLMKERLRSIGGELAVWSTPDRGTRIEARVALRESQ